MNNNNFTEKNLTLMFGPKNLELEHKLSTSKTKKTILNNIRLLLLSITII